MKYIVKRSSYSPPPYNKKEILRYAGCKESDRPDDIDGLLSACLKEADGCFSYKVCYCELPVTVTDDTCDFDVFKTKSEKLAINLKECNKVILFAATIGVGIDRLIAKYSRISPSKALFFQALGAERIEALCDEFCLDMKNNGYPDQKPRFSPGYGDLPMTVQSDISSVLDFGKHIGLSLCDSLLMSPSKSVTAFIGIKNK